MAELIIDLSGQGGLANGYAGDSDMVTPQPNLIMTKAQGELASGNFNPHLRSGYLAPTTTASTSLTIDVTPVGNLNSVEYDIVNDDTYWGDSVNKIISGSSLIDTSLTSVASIGYEGKTYEELYDLQTYKINGEDRLFFVGKSIPFSTTAPIRLGVQSTASRYAASIVSIKPSGAVKPAVTFNDRHYNASSSTTVTEAITVPVGANQCLHVIAYALSDLVAGITFNGGALDFEYIVGGTASEPSVYYGTKVNPAQTTANVVVTWASSVTQRVVHIFVTDNTDQTTPALFGARVVEASNGSTVMSSPASPIDNNELTVVSIYSDGTISSSSLREETTRLHLVNQGFGSDYLAVTTSLVGLSVGHTSLPVVAATNFEATFLSAEATIGGFIQELKADFAFMRVADNGFAYIFSGNSVHKIDGNTTGGATGTVTKNVILFPDSFSITDAVDYRSRLYLAIQDYPVSVLTTTKKSFAGSCGIYIWNRISTQLSSADFIQLPGVREIKKIYSSPDGQLRLIVISNSGIVQLRQFGYNDSGGVVFNVLKDMGIGAFPQVSDGLAVAGDKSLWAANDGSVYCEKNGTVVRLFQIKEPGVTSDTTLDNIKTGASLYGSDTETSDSGYRANKQAFTFSYLDGATQYIKKIYPFDLKNGSNTAQAQAVGSVYSGVHLIPIASDVGSIRIYNAPTESAGTTVVATIKVYFNQSTTASMPTGMTKSISMNEAKRGYVDLKINKQYINAIQIEVEWSTAINLGGDTYLPSMAVITHEATTTKTPDNG